jgi:hypothetical protein
MNKIIIALAALFASAICAPAAQAYCDADEIADGECGRGMKMPSLRKLLPPTAGPSVAAREECDADDAAELKECLRGLSGQSARPLAGPAARPAADIPAQVAPDKTAALPPDTTVASSETPAKPDGASLCQRHFPSIGQSIPVPCSE